MSTQNTINLLFIRGMVASLPADDQATVARVAAGLREQVAASGDCGKIALALVTAELAESQP